MRIGVNCSLLQPHVGGIKHYFHLLFAELLRSDVEHTYVFFHLARNADELRRLPSGRWEADAVLLQDEADVRKHLDKIDLYFCPFGVLWPRPLPLPTTVMLPDIQEVFYPEFFTAFDMFNRAYHFAGSTRMADRVITISHFTKRTIVEHHRIPAERVIVTHLCADERYYRAAEVAQRPRQRLPGAPFILYPANRWMHKNHDRLLQALRRLRDDKGLKVDLVLTGHAVENGYPLTQKVAEYGLVSQVFSLDYVSVEEMAYLYTTARMLVVPSLFEGFGIPLVEAMAAGCPVVAADTTSIPETAEDAAEYFDPLFPEAIAAAIERVWNDAALRERMIARGCQRALQFSAASMAAAHLQAFRDAVRAYSSLRYAWHRWLYGPYHHYRVLLQHRHRLRRHLQAQQPSSGRPVES